MPVRYFTCNSCGGLLREQISERDEVWREPQVAVLVSADLPCCHVFWDESGCYFREVSAGEAAMLISGDNANPGSLAPRLMVART